MFKLFFVFAAALVVSKADVSGKLYLTLFYESACPDTQQFVLRELQPAMKLLKDYIVLQLVPFGKASSINNGFGGFTCQHGKPECLGNLIQDCTLDLMSSRTDLEKVEYLVCEMQTKASTRGDLGCARQMDVPSQQVKSCMTSPEGIGLQLKSEYLTEMFKPSFIPTVTIDGVFDQKVQDNALIDLIGTLCSMLKDAKPCAQYYNNQALLLMMG